MKMRITLALSIALGVILLSQPVLAKWFKAKVVGADYKSYTQMNTTPKKSDSHDKRLVYIYVNSKGADSYKALKAPMPEGTIIAKENYEDNAGKTGKFVEISVMKKLKSGKSPSSGDWYFAVLNTDLTLKEENPKRCVDCHSFSSTDYIFGTGETK